jgi:AcrR family transcriptional regulator
VVTERRTQADRRAESQARLIEACIELLATRGYAKTSLVEIGKRAKVSRALVIHHFGSKEACMYAVVEHIRATMGARAARRDPAETALDQVLGLLDSLRTQDSHARAMFVILVESLTSSPGLLPAVAETNAVIREAISGLIKDAAADVVGGPPVDVDGLAVLIEAILRGVALQWLADPENVDLDSTIATAQQMLRAVLGQPQPGGPRASVQSARPTTKPHRSC